MKILVGQLNPRVGDIESNAERILEWIRTAQSRGADLLVFPELVLCGYPPEDLLLRDSMKLRIDRAINQIAHEVGNLTVILGYPDYRDGKTWNAAGVLRDGALHEVYYKCELPNYRVFDEKRYFVPGSQPCVVDVAGVRVGLAICEDVWHLGPVAAAVAAGADLILAINASPFHSRKHEQRLETVRQQVLAHAKPLLYVNMVGGQDELVFDGDSFMLNAQGVQVYQSRWFTECLDTILYDGSSGAVQAQMADLPDECGAIYEALVLAVRDYVGKNGFPGALLGLSGGIDSALTLAVAVDALGAGRVQAVMMPFHYTADISKVAAEQQATLMGVDYRSIPIESVYDAFENVLASEFSGLPVDVTEQNLQSRIRGVILMALSNKRGALVLTTGNKSEVAVGYSTLYGDMAGGFDVLKDLFKTRVYDLARWRNKQSPCIPQEVIDRPPSAELAPGQVDQDSLPDYDLLDQILHFYIEQDRSAAAIIEAGFDAATVERVIKLVDRNEYKRRQAPVGPRVSQRAFGRDRRYPITNGWRPGD